MLGDGKSVVLSFDDGPAPLSALENILETLRLNEIKAEFYVLGSEVKQFPEAARMIVREGHAIQNHSWSHSDLEKATARNVRLELEDTQAVIVDSTGVTPTKIRPPYGAGGFSGHIDPNWARLRGNSRSALLHGISIPRTGRHLRAWDQRRLQILRTSSLSSPARPCSMFSCTCNAEQPETCHHSLPG